MFAVRYKKQRKNSLLQKKRNLRQEELAEKASITPQYLSRIENGGYSKNVSLSTLMKIAGVLDCSAMIWY